VFREVASGAKTNRTQLRKAIASLGAGDLLMVTRLDRLARSTRDLLNSLAAITDRRAGFRSLSDAWADTPLSAPRLRRLRASRRWCGVSLGGRPILTPRALARSRPSLVRARMRSRSNSARAAQHSQHMRCRDIARSYNVSPATISRSHEAVSADV
jgi:hypothetical protein